MFGFPTEVALENGWRSAHGSLHKARGVPTIVVTWLVSKTQRRVCTWDVDHGDGCGMYEHALPSVRAVEWNKLLGRDEHLEVVAYDVPMNALREVQSV